MLNDKLKPSNFMKKKLFLVILFIVTSSVVSAQEAKEEDNTIYNTASVQVKPEFPGGISEFLKYVGSNYKVPDVKGLSGNVYASFVIEKDGSVSDVKVIRDIGNGTGQEAVRVLMNSPKWTPAQQNGKLVRVTFVIPIKIQPK